MAAFATSYIKTEAATVTRNADEASMTGTNFSSWYRQDEGTLYAEGLAPTLIGTFPHIVGTWDDGYSTSRTNRIIFSSSNGISPRAFGTIIYTSPALTSGSAYKAVLGYKSNDNAAYVNNVGGTNTAAFLNFTATNLQIGIQPGLVSNKLNSTIKKIAFYPSRLPDAQLQALTS